MEEAGTHLLRLARSMEQGSTDLLRLASSMDWGTVANHDNLGDIVTDMTTDMTADMHLREQIVNLRVGISNLHHSNRVETGGRLNYPHTRLGYVTFHHIPYGVQHFFPFFSLLFLSHL
jgi:hypothetical protein